MAGPTAATEASLSDLSQNGYGVLQKPSPPDPPRPAKIYIYIYSSRRILAEVGRKTRSLDRNGSFDVLTLPRDPPGDGSQEHSKIVLSTARPEGQSRTPVCTSGRLVNPKHVPSRAGPDFAMVPGRSQLPLLNGGPTGCFELSLDFRSSHVCPNCRACIRMWALKKLPMQPVQRCSVYIMEGVSGPPPLIEKQPFGGPWGRISICIAVSIYIYNHGMRQVSRR